MSAEKPQGPAVGLTDYGDRDFALYLRRSFASAMGYSRAMLARPVIGIATTPSGFNNCHRHVPELLEEAVQQGVLAAGDLRARPDQRSEHPGSWRCGWRCPRPGR